MVTRRPANSSLGQSLPWFVAAVLVIVGSGLIALWLNHTAATADRDTLARGADAIASNVDEQIRILALAGTGAQSLSGQSIERAVLEQMVGQIDVTVLSSLLAVIAYPVDADGAGAGESLLPELQIGFVGLNVEPPDIELTVDEFDQLLASGDAFFSSPFSTGSSERLDYVVAMPSIDGDTRSLTGVVFRPDVMLETSVDGAGEGQYAVEVIDSRLDERLVATIGEPSSEIETRRSPEGVRTALELVVRPGSGFHFGQSPWITRLVVGTGVLIAMLLVWMGRMARARADDLAERLRLAQELNESKDRFLATVSHELRTPLTVVLGVASEVGPNWESFDDADRQDLMTMLIEQASEAANIVEDLLVAARSDPSQLRLAMESTNLSPHVEYAIASLPDGSRSRVTCRGIDRPVYADSTRLRQILRNLLENAVKYGGPDIVVESALTDQELVIVVSDNGESLVESDFSRIFEPYEQATPEGPEAPTGVGIGLYVSRLLAQLMEGNLECVRNGARTEFRLALSASDSAAGTQKAIGAAAS